jgi:hypothetical protein
MIRLTWLQFRVQAFAGVAALAVVGIVLAITGPSLHHLYTAALDCHAKGDCATAAAAFAGKDHTLQIMVNVLVEVAPALVGLFWGAPLVAREFETGTYRLAWTQTTRTRWIAVKLAGIGLAGIALTGILSLIVTWWSGPLDAAAMAPYSSFDQRDLVPLGYAAFAFAVGVTAGLLIRRTVPAMAAALVVFAPIRLAVALWVRPHLVSPLRRSFPDVLATPGPPPGGQVTAAPEVSAGPQLPNPRDWVLSDQTVNASGHVIGASGSIGSENGLAMVSKNHGVVLGGGYSCPNITAPHQPLRHGQFAALVQKCVNQLHIREVLTYQPVSRYWPLQWREFAIFLAAAVLLSGCCLWSARRRIG